MAWGIQVHLMDLLKWLITAAIGPSVAISICWGDEVYRCMDVWTFSLYILGTCVKLIATVSSLNCASHMLPPRRGGHMVLRP